MGASWAETKEGAPTGAPSKLLERWGELTREKPDDSSYSGPGGIVIHKDEAVELFNLLEANARDWNHRLRVVLSGWILHLVNEGKIDGNFEVVSQKERHTPSR